MKLKKFFTILLVFVLTLSFAVPSYASVSDVVTAVDVVTASDFSWRNLFAKFGIVAVSNGLGNDFINYLDHTSYDVDNEHLGGGHSRAYKFINDNLHVGDDKSITPNETFNQYAIDFLNQYINEHPLGYYPITISSIHNIDATNLPTLAAYNALLNDVDTHNSKYALVAYTIGGGSINGLHFVSFNDFSNFGLIGTVSADGLFTSVGNSGIYYNWSNINSFVDVPGTRYGAFNNAGTYSATNRSIGTTVNGRAIYQTSKYTFLSCSDKDEIMYIFSSIDSLKTYDSGTPAPYYISNDFGNTSIFTLNQNQYDNSYNPYSYISDHITSGMTPSEINNIVTISIDGINSGGGSGSGGGSDSDDGFFDGLFAGLGSLIKSFFKGIADLLGSIAEGLGNLLESITSIIGNLIDNFTSEDGSIFGFLKAFMNWLPDPIPSLLTSFFVLAVIFGVIKLIKGAFS